MHRFCLAAAGLFAAVSLTPAEDWPAWRGPRSDGTVKDSGFALTWDGTKGENIRWKTPLPASGHSSPVVSKGKIFVTGCIEDQRKRVLYCLDRSTGSILWERVVLEADLEKKHGENSYASSTPACDGEHVYVTFLDKPKMRVFCYDYNGNKVWEKNPGEFYSVHGFCSPPTLYKDLVIVNGDQDALAYIVALDRKTGEEKWRANRPNKKRSYCPPVIVHAAGKDQMVLTGSMSVASYDPNTGKQFWLIDGPTEQFVSSMVLHDGLLLMTAGFPEHWVMAIKPDGLGNVTKTHVAWANGKQGGYVPSPVAHDGKLYLVDDKGIAGCYDVKTGDRHWQERLSFKKHHASAIAADGRIYLPADDGITYVIAADPKQFDIVAKNTLGENVYASPAFSGGEIFLRGAKHLWCIAEAKK